ncbi:MAG: DeoR/GlpR family DNA-binding transcription regulator [Bernardetiaceae bacterium]|jgi:DeoR/GlpR family transcriptional regulator of sugar metabolism|nr:DeoR/GlpR family DNA-binding transcription regulator [Bernardetiaceae bacterium]
MLKEERWGLILARLQTGQRVGSAELSRELGVSDDTIRRDLQELAQQGQLRKVHGGALAWVAPPRPPAPLEYGERAHYAQAAKRALAQKSLELLQSGQVVILDGSTTNLQVASLLPASLAITVFTNSPVIATALMAHPRAEVILLGGRVFKPSQVTVDQTVTDALAGLRADWYFLGVCSVHPQLGITNFYWEETQIKRRMVLAAARTVALATADKLDTAEHYQVCPCTALHTLVTDAPLGPEQAEVYQRQGVQVWPV